MTCKQLIRLPHNHPDAIFIAFADLLDITVFIQRTGLASYNARQKYAVRQVALNYSFSCHLFGSGVAIHKLVWRRWIDSRNYYVLNPVYLILCSGGDYREF